MTPAQAQLAARMSDISEEYYAAGWLCDLEYILWDMLHGGSREFGMGTVSEAEIAELRQLSSACGGWIVWGYDGREFIAFHDWMINYDERSERVKGAGR